MTPKEDKRQDLKAARFRELHEAGTFVIPNPWDPGSAKVLAGLGFEALATTSSGFAYSLGRSDGAVTLDELVRHVGLLDQATQLPVSVDLEDGFGASPEQVAEAVRAAAAAGAVGGSIEDYSAKTGIYELGAAAERIEAAVETSRELPRDFTLTARAENFFRGNPDLDDTIERLLAFERAGADVLFAPRLRHMEQVRAITDAVSKPVNALAFPGSCLADFVDAGVRRVSVGGTLAWAALSSLVDAARRIQTDGSFDGLTGPPPELRDWLDR